MIHNTPCFRHKILHTLCFFFHLSWVQMSQEKLEDNGFAKFWESVLWEMSKWQISISLRVVRKLLSSKHCEVAYCKYF